ncbi:MAG: bifunctional riboflavin kinase/FAD synthetase [Coriobacteriia bacterium]|nr:bifunctional riboflavin kinase/FAD synthetase [Coriobacteriia bacterium]MBN2840040.1 bifunctional riboflavin kinase/FAD synthetase [Coriobacteriia bacterium]
MTQTLWHRTDEQRIGEAAVAIGVFDGVHIGHQTLIRDAVETAADEGVMCCVVTFDRDPDQVVTPDRAAPQLTSLDDKLALISELGPDVILVVPFDTRLAALSPDSFIDDVLMRVLIPRVVIVGEDFRFGVRASGDVATLRACGERDGFEVIAHELVTREGSPVTSTRVRALVDAGDVAAAARLLDRPHRLEGRVVAGRSRGRGLGAPTANLVFDPRMALPGEGVYAARVAHGSSVYRAAVSVGMPPTFADAMSRFEVHLLDFEGDLYGATLNVEFVDRIGAHRHYDAEGDLAAAISTFIVAVRERVAL